MITRAILTLLAGLASEPTIVGPGVISTELVERGGVFDPVDGSLYFVRSDAPWGEPSCGRILGSRPAGGRWTDPEPVFEGDACYDDPFVSSDGERLYFTSNAHRDPARRDDDIWVAKRAADGWGPPERVPGVNSEGQEASPVETASGSLYFSSTRPGGLGQGDLWRARASAPGFAEPEPLGPIVNGPTGEWNLLVAADESWIIFEASGRPEGLSPAGDLYLSLATAEGWSRPRHLAAVNTTGSDLMPRLSLDGAALLYTSTRSAASRNADLYLVPLSEVASELVR